MQVLMMMKTEECVDICGATLLLFIFLLLISSSLKKKKVLYR